MPRVHTHNFQSDIPLMLLRVLHRRRRYARVYLSVYVRVCPTSTGRIKPHTHAGTHQPQSDGATNTSPYTPPPPCFRSLLMFMPSPYDDDYAIIHSRKMRARMTTGLLSAHGVRSVFMFSCGTCAPACVCARVSSALCARIQMQTQ